MTLADRVNTAPDAAHGRRLTNWPTPVAGHYRWVVEGLDPASEDPEWHDLTRFYLSDHYERGADQFMGRYRAAVLNVQFQLDNHEADELGVSRDILAPWYEDNSDLFGVHVPLGSGLLLRAGVILVNGGVVVGSGAVGVGWWPTWTGRVETWGDASQALGQIRTYAVQVIDLLSDLVSSPVPGVIGASLWQHQLDQILTQCDWLFGYDIYGSYDVIELPLRDPPLASAALELDANTDPIGIAWRTRRTGRLIFHPQPFDEFHASFEDESDWEGAIWQNPTLASYADGLVFNYQPDLTDIAFIGLKYADDRVPSFGIEDTSKGVINSINATMPGGGYPVDDAVSIARHGIKHLELDWIVDNEPAVDQLLAARANATKQALPLMVTCDLPGFWPAMGLIDHLDPVTVVNATHEGGAVVTGEGTVRRIVEDRQFIGGDSANETGMLQWVSVVQLDIESTAVSEQLLPVENLTATLQANYADFTWTNPTQTLEPTDTQYRVLGISNLWLDLPYPIDGTSSGILAPSTPYQVQVRLVRKVNGVIKNVSPVRTYDFVTRPPYTPDLGPGDNGDETDVDIPADGECVIEWVIEENDGTGWTTFMSGDLDDLVLGDDGLYHLPDPIDNDAFDEDKQYRVGYREDCGEGFGDWIYGPAEDIPDDWEDPCTEPPALSEAPFDDPDLLVYVPKVCAPNIITEAVSGIAGVHGAAYGDLLQVLDEPDRLALQAIAQPAWDAAPGGIIAYGECPQTDGVTGSKTITAKAYIHDPEFCVLNEMHALRITCTPSGSGWKAGATVFTADGTGTCMSSELDVDTAYDIVATYDADTGDLTLYVDGVEDGDTSFGETRDTINSLPIWRVGAPPESWVTDCALFDGVHPPPLTRVDVPEATDNFNRANSSSLGSNWTESGASALSIASDALSHTSASATSGIWNTQMSSEDHYVEFQIRTGGSNIAAWLRGDATTPTEGYQCSYSAGDGQFRIHRFSGSFTLIASATTTGPALNDILRAEVEGSVITILVNGVPKLSFDDSAFGSGFAGNRYVGVRGFANSANVDNFEAGTFDYV